MVVSLGSRNQCSTTVFGYRAATLAVNFERSKEEKVACGGHFEWLVCGVIACFTTVTRQEVSSFFFSYFCIGGGGGRVCLQMAEGAVTEVWHQMETGLMSFSEATESQRQQSTAWETTRLCASHTKTFIRFHLSSAFNTRVGTSALLKVQIQKSEGTWMWSEAADSDGMVVNG